MGIPLADAIDSTHMYGQFVLHTPLSQLPNIDELRRQCCAANAAGVNSWTADSWIRNLDLTGFNQFTVVGYKFSRIAVDLVVMDLDGTTNNGTRYALDISVDGTQVLVKDCSTLRPADSRSVVAGSGHEWTINNGKLKVLAGM
ncbi:hypothetical protein K432DRAFT_392130 [Lepidopterella palustris CBS 459.81]|uniref:Uncharacterized protein n=1 Tax=Lepidopterella palustris CBS 459.81 TaxID=1314670 RepID=A0A8E2ECK8_9PEZI|nr:hypothetical protein K432DRAFT_392130 [Lepidopterella palustris CBS 459.81]